MSIQAVAWVLDHSRSRGFSRLVLISLANHHNKGTGQCNPGQRTIADEAGISLGAVGPNVAKLVELGEVEILAPGTSHRSADYGLPFMADGLSTELSTRDRNLTTPDRFAQDVNVDDPHYVQNDPHYVQNSPKYVQPRAEQNHEPGTSKARASQEKRKIADALAVGRPNSESPEVELHHPDPDEVERVRAGPLAEARRRVGLAPQPAPERNPAHDGDPDA